jgi:hypothetical protein
VRPRTLLVLLVVVLVLAAFVRFYERDLPSSEERAQRAKKVFAFDKDWKDKVTRVRLRSDGTSVVIERQPGGSPAKPASSPAVSPDDAAAPGSIPPAAPSSTAAADWRLVQPIAARADGAAVDRLLDSLGNLEKARTIEAANRAEVGLDKPRAEVGLTFAGQSGETVLDVGAAIPTGGQTIVGLAGHPEAYVASDSVLGDLRRKPGDWRDRQLFHGDRDRIRRVTYTVAGGPPVELAKRGDGFWITAPALHLADRADRDQVEKLLTDVTGLAAERFLDPPTAPGTPGAAPAPDPAQLGLQPPHAVVEVAIDGQAQPFRVELGASHPAPPAPVAPPEPGAPPPPPEPPGTLTAARVGTALVETRSALAATIARPPADWRSPLLSCLEAHQIDGVVVTAAGTPPLRLTRAGTDWKRGAVTVSYLPVSDLLFTVTEAKADRWLSADEARTIGAGTTPPILTFELAAAAAAGGKTGNETITLYAPLAGKGVPARAAGRDSVLLLPEAKLKEIQDRLTAVRTAGPLIGAAQGPAPAANP